MAFDLLHVKGNRHQHQAEQGCGRGPRDRKKVAPGLRVESVHVDMVWTFEPARSCFIRVGGSRIER
jgi:hypothetical protein